MAVSMDSTTFRWLRENTSCPSLTITNDRGSMVLYLRPEHEIAVRHMLEWMSSSIAYFQGGWSAIIIEAPHP